MSTALATRPATASTSVTVAMADRYGMDPAAFEQTLRATVVPGNCSREQFAAFLLVAKEHRLNPVTREIYAMPAKSGGIQPIVSIDGWMNLMNQHPQMNGLEFEDKLDDAGKIIAITARIWRKDRDKPITITEYMAECRRDTPTWKQWPARMLRHKAAIQAARYAFGFSGIQEPDEYERGAEALRAVPPSAPIASAPASPGARAIAGPPSAAPVAPPAAPHPQPQAGQSSQARRGPPPAPAAAPVELVVEAEPPSEEQVIAAFEDDCGACGDLETLNEVWVRFEGVSDAISRNGRERATGLYEQHSRRIGA